MCRLEQDQNKCPLYRIAEYPLLRGLNILQSMEIQSGHSELSQVSVKRGSTIYLLLL